MGKGLGFSPAPSLINESDLERDFSNFSRIVTSHSLKRFLIESFLQ